jgi:predicted nucleic acid-binding protein
LTKTDEIILKMALSNFKNINICDEIKTQTINIRKKYKLKLPDSIIVATAIVYDATLVTFDKQLIYSKLVDTIGLLDLNIRGHL